MLASSLLLCAAALANTAFAQSQYETTFTDSYGITLSGLFDTSVDFQLGFVLPISNKSTEFIGEFIVPVANKWAGISLGPGMVGNPLIMAWPYNGGVQHSVRYSTDYGYPLPYAGPIITTLHTKTNATHWDWVFRCQNCTTWSTGAGQIDQTGPGGIGYVLSNIPVDTPSNPNTTFSEHTYENVEAVDFSKAHTSKYNSYI